MRACFRKWVEARGTVGGEALLAFEGTSDVAEKGELFLGVVSVVRRDDLLVSYLLCLHHFVDGIRDPFRQHRC